VKNVLWDHAKGKLLGVGPKDWTLATGQEVSAGVLEIETRTALDGGFSGGPVVNAANELVGVTLAAGGETSRRVYCVEAAAVRRQLAESYSTLALTAIGAGDGAARQGLVGVVAGCVRIERKSSGGVHP
jgi:S1-C subfamily serine protease